MIDITSAFIIWGIITVLFAVIAIVCYHWLSNVARFEKKKKEIAIGFILCVLAVSSITFIPILFSRIDLHSFGTELYNSIESAETDANDNDVNFIVEPFVKPFAYFLAVSSPIIIKLVIFYLPILISLLIVFFIVLIILKIRDPKKIDEDEENRKHLFEYKSEILSKLNKETQR